jgi:hypothetical protein
MAFSLLLDEPTVEVARNGKEVLGEPARSTVAAIYGCAIASSLLVVLVGVVAMLLPARIAVPVPALAAIAVTVVLLVPLDTWADEHTKRYPNGIDLLPPGDTSDLILRGEWEENARRTANQIGLWTIAIGIAAIVIAIALDIRRRRGSIAPPVAPPPDIAGDPQVAPSRAQHPPTAR